MPKAKRSKLVSLTKTMKRSTKEQKEALISSIRDALKDFSHVYVFAISNVRSRQMKDVRKQLHDSRIFMTKNKVMQKALGKEEKDEVEPGLSQVAQHMHGTCGLLFSNHNLQKIEQLFAKSKTIDFARAGFIADQEVVLKAGCIDWMPYTSSIEERLVRLGLPIEVKEGKVHIRYDYTVCKEGDTLSPEQSKILKQFGYRLSQFSLELRCVWDREDGYKKLVNPDDTTTTTTTTKTSAMEQDDDDEEEADE